MRRVLFTVGAALIALPFFAATPSRAAGVGDADIVILGEVHDNPAHHATQAQIVAQLQPTAIVFEMLTPQQADAAIGIDRQDKPTLELALRWADSGWPDFAMYHPIFTASEAAIHGAAVPRAIARQAFTDGIEQYFGAEAEAYGLTTALPDAEQTAREAAQAKAHCDALPEDLLPKMVALQRLRDATLARAAVTALSEHGGPVVVITGNGHARQDWGMPVYIRRVAPEAALYVLGQSEEGTLPAGQFDETSDGPKVDRGDPCEAFR